MPKNRSDLITELSQQLVIAYNEQIYEDSVGCGPDYLSSLVWDIWRGLPVNPNDPIPYVQAILPPETGDRIQLCEDTRISGLDKATQDFLYSECAEKMWEIIQKDTNQ